MDRPHLIITRESHSYHNYTYVLYIYKEYLGVEIPPLNHIMQKIYLFIVVCLRFLQNISSYDSVSYLLLYYVIMKINDYNTVCKALHKLNLNTKIKHPPKLTLTTRSRLNKSIVFLEISKKTLFKKIPLKKRPYNLIHTSPLSLVASWCTYIFCITISTFVAYM